MSAATTITRHDHDGDALTIGCPACIEQVRTEQKAAEWAPVPALPTPSRSLYNEIARYLLDEITEGRTVDELRSALIDGGKAVEALQGYVLVFGPVALIEAL